jgi:sugar phosphate isomerase/epimerase
MPVNRREFLAASAAGVVGLGADVPRPGLGVLLYSYGIRAAAERAKGFADPAAFAAFCRDRGANCVQVPLGSRPDAEAKKLRDGLGELGVAVEGIVRAPADEKDTDRFDAEIRTAAACGADVVRTVMLGGRRYETFTKPDDYPPFAARSERSLKLAEPVIRRHRVKLAVENHKDFRTDELLGLLKRIDSEYVGVCLDTGNSIALLEDALTTARELAKWTFTVHLKDMGVEESPTGFLLAEVPLGQGLLDLKAITSAVRVANPKARFNLEMITRDPLVIPCLTEKYWATLEKVSGRDLARTLAWVRANPRKEPLPRIGKLPPDEQVTVEDRHVRESFEYAAREKLV